MFWQILFWILLILCALGVIAPDSPYILKGRWGVVLLLIAILGFKVFGGLPG